MQLMSSMNKENLIFPFQSLGRFFLFALLYWQGQALEWWWEVAAGATPHSWSQRK